MMTLWKGLFYCMWMSDKPLVQEELAENISNLLSCLDQNPAAAFAFISAFFNTMSGDWSSIDTYRIGKFQMLVRRMLRQALRLASRNEWEMAPQLGEVLWSSILSAECRPALGLSLHVCEIFLEELAKVSGNSALSQKALTELLRPFVQCLASKAGEPRLRGTITNSVFSELIKQSDEGLEHQEKLDAWRRMGCPAIPLDQLERVELDNEEVNEEDEAESEETSNELDPRAGQLDVELPQIPFDPAQVAALFHEFISISDTSSKVKRRLKNVAKRFEDLAQGQYPLKFELPLANEADEVLEWDDEDAIEDAAHSLKDFETQLTHEEAKLGVAKRAALKRLAAQELQQPVVKKQRRRSRRSITHSSWEITEIDAEGTESALQNGDPVSPGNQGLWEVSPITTSEKSTSSSNKWEEPLQDGEYEYFVTPRKKKQPELFKRKSKKSKSPEATADSLQINITDGTSMMKNGTNNMTPSKQDNDVAIGFTTPPATSKKSMFITTPGSSSSYTVKGLDSLSMSMGSGRKKVEFKLTRNMFQEVREYAEQLRNSPGIPHDPNKRPTQGLLKPSTPTPVLTPTTRKRTRVFT
ncbi:hypothetical protein B566_EDAN009629 [Ephemera danica]|nr:hypothetical protein B566_EDAN009629 [Ephemera danica]